MRLRIAMAILLFFPLLWAGESLFSAGPNPISRNEMYNHRFHVFFTGKVQGVGFRQAVKTYAMELELVGWVKNLEDQRVEMVVEGPEPDFNLLVGKLCSEFEVQKAEVKKERPQGSLKGFEIVK